MQERPPEVSAASMRKRYCRISGSLDEMKSKLLPHTDGQGLIAKGGADQERNADMYGLIWALVFRRANTEQ